VFALVHLGAVDDDGGARGDQSQQQEIFPIEAPRLLHADVEHAHGASLDRERDAGERDDALILQIHDGDVGFPEVVDDERGLRGGDAAGEARAHGDAADRPTFESERMPHHELVLALVQDQDHRRICLDRVTHTDEQLAQELVQRSR
jgi:hypothetical protein